MAFTVREFWAVLHGLLFGGLFLVAFAGGAAGIYSLRRSLVTTEGIRERLRRLRWGSVALAVAAWVTVISGTFIVYPWYRATPPPEADLSAYPRSFLKADPALALWHTFGMEWKEHVAWLAPILAVPVVFIVFRYGSSLADNDALRRATLWTLTVSFVAAAIAGVLGALITKAAPVL